MFILFLTVPVPSPSRPLPSLQHGLLLSFTFWESEVESQAIMHARQMLYHQAAPLALPLSLYVHLLSAGLRALRRLML